MTAVDGAAAPDPFFLDRNGRRLFVVGYVPAGAPRTSLLIIPPFAEEMNRSRRMMALLGRALAAAGVACAVLDPFGTGDSSGDFADARWDIWLDDVSAAAAWLADRTGHRPTVLGLRTGALLAAAAVRDSGRIVLWQPVGNGQNFLNQFLRIRVASDLAGAGGGAKETTKSLRAEWDAGRSVEIAGYDIHPDLAAAMDALRLEALPPPAGVAAHWIELSRDDDGPSPASLRIIDSWRAAGAAVDVRTCTGEPFWTIQEVTLAPAMIEATVSILSEAVAA